MNKEYTCDLASLDHDNDNLTFHIRYALSKVRGRPFVVICKKCRKTLEKAHAMPPWPEITKEEAIAMQIVES